MTTKEITSIALKFFAIYLIANILFTLPTALWVQTMISAALDRAGEKSAGLLLAWAVGGAIVIVGIILAIFLWRLSNSLVDVNKQVDFQRTSPFSITEIELLVIAGIGLFFVVEAIPSVGYSAISIFDGAAVRNREGLNIPAVATTVVSLVQLLIGISLVLLPSWWANLFRKARQKVSSNTAPERDA